MRKVILALMLLTGCAHTHEDMATKTQFYWIQKRIWDLTYQIEVDQCFIQYHRCRWDNKVKEPVCFERQEKCVIEAYNRYKRDI